MNTLTLTAKNDVQSFPGWSLLRLWKEPELRHLCHRIECKFDKLRTKKTLETTFSAASFGRSSSFFAFSLLLGLGTMVLSSAHAADPQIETVQKGESKDLYFQINLSGKVFVNVGGPPGGTNCAEFWWIKWPLGNIQSLGRHCGVASFDIPGVLDFAISSKLRVGGTDNLVKIAISATESIANSATFSF